jgi:PAS domain S-box-containing protein
MKYVGIQDYFFGIIILLLVATGITTFMQLKISSKLEDAEKKHYRSLILAQELKESSDLLTRYCRTYVITGDSIWEKKYWNVYDIRNGLKPRPDGNTIALLDTLKELGLSTDELMRLELAEKNSDALIWKTEEVAFHAVKGIFADSLGNYTIKKKPDRELALKALYDEEYFHDKKNIMSPIEEFTELIYKRTLNQVTQLKKNRNRFLRVTYVIIFLLGFFSFYAIYILRKKINQQLSSLVGSKKHLDAKVKERTRELESKNQDLRTLEEELRSNNEELYQVNEKLTISEEKFRFLSDMAHEGIAVHQNGIVIDINKALTKIFGYPKEELLGEMQIEKLFHKNFQEQIKQNMAIGYDKPYEAKAIKNDGTEIWVEIFGKNTSDKKDTRRVVIFRDITERKIIENEFKNKNQEYEALNEELRQTNEELYNSRRIIELSEKKFRQLFENMEQGFAVHEMVYDNECQPIDYEFKMANKAFGELTGLNPVEIIGKTVKQLLPKTEQSWIEKYGEVAKTGKPMHFESYSVELDRYYSVVAYSPNENNFAVIFHDVSEKKKNEQNLIIEKEITEAFARYTNYELFDTLNNILTSHFECEFGYIGYINKKEDLICPSMTHSIWEKCNSSEKDIVFPKEKWGGLWGESLKQRKTLFKNEGINVPNGHIHLKNAIAVAISDSKELMGQFVLANCQVNFSSRHKEQMQRVARLIAPLLKSYLKESEFKDGIIQAKIQAEENERRLNSIIENTEAGYFFINKEGYFQRVNKAWLSLYKFANKDEVIGKHFTYVQKIDDIEQSKAFVTGIINQNPAFTCGEFSRKCKDGSVGYHTFSAGPVKEGNKIIGIEGFIIDTTEKKQYEQQLVKAKEKAEESDRLKSEFLRNMSHEIRTPMNGIMGFAELLTKEELPNESKRQYVSIIQTSCYQLINILDDILEISYLETRQVQPVFAPVNLNELLMEQFTLFNLKAKEKGIQLYIKKQLTKQESQIITDKTKLLKALNNILENAIKFTSKGSVEFGYELEKNSMILFVKDTGIGISPENLQSIFIRFSQENKDLTQNVGGLGLGLSIAKENIELLGGNINVESVKGEGSTFYLTIPYKPTKDELQNYNTMKTEEALVETGVQKILIAEDEEINFLYLEAILTDYSEDEFSIVHAKNGQEAVEQIQKTSDFDIILMDIKMPVMDGFEATKRIKQLQPGIPIIAQTAYTTQEDKDKALASGCNAFISKPINTKELFQIIKALRKNKQD